MELGGGTSGVKPVDVDLKRVDLHNANSSELSMSTASNTMLPHLEATDAERALNEDERRMRKEARKLKREAREKKKKGQQQLEDKKQRKEERKLKREARRKRREARKKKEEEAKATNASSSELSSSFEDGDDDESYQMIKNIRKDKKGKGKDDNNDKYATVSFN
ncbi:protein PXR1-like [Miscanthus floridulus]|uniref:protein PXR1-like n=1 Tax=Miscanthus floridulus TaxID=154761 RepID=UPI00345AC311